MRLVILGARGNIPASAAGYARHSGILIDAHILLDLGEPSYLRYHPRHIFITHLHPDHAAVPRRGGRATTCATIYAPERSLKLPDARLITRAVRAGPYRVVPVPTQHSHAVKSVGYIVEKGRRRIFYSSDLFSIHPRHRRRLGRLDLVITDGSFMRRGGLVRTDPATGKRFGHAGIPDLVEFFGRYTRRIFIAHFGSWFYKDVAGSIRRIASLSDGADVRATRDGMVIRV